jgi:purine-nucleoside phosphorylase
MILEGRMHLYEGYPASQITLPVRVLHHLGAELLIVTNACGGLNPHYSAGDIMVIDDHINLMHDNPLVGINDDRLGPRFPDMSEPYAFPLIDRALEVARQKNFVAHRGVYVAVTGPNLETRAEYRFLRTIGADVVGMSTVPEAIALNHMGIDVGGISLVTNFAAGITDTPLSHEEVTETAAEARERFSGVLDALLPMLVNR